AVIEKMMSKDPAQRYQTPDEVVEALAPWTQATIPPPAESEMPRLSPAAMGGAPSDASGTKPTSSSTKPPSSKTRRASQAAATSGSQPAKASTPPKAPAPAPGPKSPN